MKTDKFCQSCGMPFGKVEYGIETNGETSNKYCSLCYKDGEFIEKEITYDEMLTRGIESIESQNISSFKKKMLIKFYPKLLSEVERWKK